MLNYKAYILNESKKEKKIKNKILKWFPIEYIIDKAIEVNSKLAVWIVNQIIEKVIIDYALDNPIRDEDKMAKDKESKENARTYIQRNLKDPEVEKLFIKTWAKNVNEIRYIMDWVNSYGISIEDRNNLTKMSFDEAHDKAEEWHDSLKAGGEMDIEEKGNILIQYPDGFYWVDLKTTDSNDEAECMGHCGRTNKGNTIYSLRRKQSNGKISCHITSAIDSNNGIIYQMKGKGNTKPINKYHKYIVDLLMDDKLDIKGFGAEYFKEKDFDIKDLSKELHDKIIAKKPDINNVAWTDDEIDDMFGRYVEDYYSEQNNPGYGFNLVQRIYDATDFKTIMESRMWNENVLFKILVKENENNEKIRKELLPPEKSAFETDEEFREYYLDQFSAHIPAEKIAKKVNVEIKSEIPLENWENIFTVLDRDNILKIADGFGIEEIFTTEDERYEDFLYEYEDNVEGLMDLLFGEDEKKQWEMLEKLFYNDGSIYNNNVDKKYKERVNAVYDIWDYDVLVERLKETFTTKEMLEEMEQGEFRELYPEYY